MPNTGDTFITILKKSHLSWGTHRHTTTRGIIYGEGYLHIPRIEAIRLSIYNSNKPNAVIKYKCTSTDGFFNAVTLKASGSMVSGDIYAKQFQGSGNLKLLGDWFKHINAVVGDRVRITWTSPTEITITKI